MNPRVSVTLLQVRDAALSKASLGNEIILPTPLSMSFGHTRVFLIIMKIIYNKQLMSFANLTY